MRLFRKALRRIYLGLQDAILVIRTKIVIINGVYPATLVVIIRLQAFESFELLLRKFTRGFD
jgi:hypothetical protein